jgi:hypothetical protein
MGPDDRMQYPPAQSSMRHLHIQVSWPQRSARASNNNNLVAARELGFEAPGLPSPKLELALAVFLLGTSPEGLALERR